MKRVVVNLEGGDYEECSDVVNIDIGDRFLVVNEKNGTRNTFLLSRVLYWIEETDDAA